MYLTRRQALALGLSSLVPQAWAQTKLADLLKIVVPYPPGGALDSTARIFAETYSTMTGNRCIVENKPGASTIIAASSVSRSKPDGSSVLWTTGGHLTNAVLIKDLPFDPLKDFTPVTMVYKADGFALMTRSDGPFKSVADVIEAAKKKPGSVTYASAGNGNTTHIVGALFAKNAGIDLLHVPYKGTPLTDLMSGIVDLTFVASSSVIQYVKTGKMLALAITGDKRSPALPDVPTLTETGLKDVGVPAYICLLAPPNMPKEVLLALYGNFKKVIDNPKFSAQLRDLGNETVGMPPNAFSEYLDAELAQYRKILPPLGIKMG